MQLRANSEVLPTTAQ